MQQQFIRLLTAIWLLLYSKLPLLPPVVSSPPPDPIQCDLAGNCTLTNAYGAFSDRSTCSVRRVAYPTTEQELVAVVAHATARKIKMKAVTRYSHSIPKLACPGNGSGDGLIISTRLMNRTLSIDAATMTTTVEPGILVITPSAEAHQSPKPKPNQ